MKKTLTVNFLIALAIALAVMSALLVVRFDGNITGFFCIGDSLPLSPYLQEETTWVNDGSAGYDGQMFLTLALDPTLRHADTYAALDNPQYRYRRIGYPLLGYIIGLGRPAAIPYALVLVNVLACAAIVLLGTRISRFSPARVELPSYSSLILLTAPGLWVSLCLSTADLLAAVLLVAGLLAMRMQRDSLAAISLCCACFVREIYLASLLVLGLFEYAKGKRCAALWFMLAAIPPILWILFIRFSVSAGTSGTHENLGIPVIGIIEVIRSVIGRELSAANMFEIFCLFLLLSTAVVVSVGTLMTRHNPPPEYIAVLPFVLLLVLSRPQILDYHGGYLRVFLPLFLVPCLTLSSRRGLIGKVTILVLSFICSAAYVINMVIS